MGSAVLNASEGSGAGKPRCDFCVVVAGAIVTELMFSKGTDALWSAANGGKLVEHVDWAKWSADDDEDDDDDDDD